jgi:DNA-directed RNA polymerase specialized sigma24 family protein
MIPGKRKAYIKCPDTNSCAKCPHKGDKQAPVISLDGLVESGYDPAASASPEENAVAKSEYRSIKAVMDGADIRISKAFEMKELLGFTVKEIATELHISEPRVYQLVARARAIGREYRQKNG